MSNNKGRYARALSLSLDWDNVISGIKATKTGEPREISIMYEKPQVKFCTKSSYTGQWDILGMAGFGTYEFPHGVEYEGHLKDGMFHGEGVLSYPMGQKIDGNWDKGRLVSCKFRFADGLEYDTPWKYCQMPDRRFWTSIQEGLRPAGRELLTNVNPPRIIPENCYDTGDGFYNPKTKCVTSPSDPRKILRIPTASEEKWIMDNCRKAWESNTGYRPDLYENWVSGRQAELEEEISTPSGDSDRYNSSAPQYTIDESLDFILTAVQDTSEDSSAAEWWKEP